MREPPDSYKDMFLFLVLCNDNYDNCNQSSIYINFLNEMFLLTFSHMIIFIQYQQLFRNNDLKINTGWSILSFLGPNVCSQSLWHNLASHMTAKEIILSWFSVSESCTIIQSRADYC